MRRTSLRPPHLVVGLAFTWASALALTGCARVVNEVGGSVLQHSLGTALGPCRAPMDSVAQARGKPWRTYRADETEDGTIRFWYESAYRVRGADGTDLADTVHVVGFLWDGGASACDIRERRATRPGPLGMPWRDAGLVPAKAPGADYGVSIQRRSGASHSERGR